MAPEVGAAVGVGVGRGVAVAVAVTVAVARAPESWTARLATNGRLGVVERSGPVGRAVLYVKAADGLGRRDLFDSFSPVLTGFKAEHGFAF